MLRLFLHRRSGSQRHLRLIPILCILFVTSHVYASDENDHSANKRLLESEVVVPEGLWQPTLNDNAYEQAPTMALIPPPPLAPPPLKQLSLMLDWYISPQHAALIIAQERGFFEAQGLEIDVQTPADPTIAIKLLAAGDVDLALTRQPLLHLYAHDSTPIMRIGTLIETPLTAIVVAGDQYQGDDALERLAELHYGFSTREGRDVIFKQLTPHDIQQADDYPPPNNVRFAALSALREGSVEAIADGFFHYLPTQLATEGIATSIIAYHELSIPRHDGLIVVANSATVARRASTWSRFLIAIEDANHWMIDNSSAAWSLLTTAHPVLDNTINYQAWQDLLKRVALSPAALDVRRYSAFERYLLEAGFIETPLPVSRLATDPNTI